MNENRCPLETKVLEALAGGALEGDLAGHARSCPICREALLVHSWMGEFRNKTADADLREMVLPDPKILWTGAASPVPDKAVVRKVLSPLRYFWIAASAGLALLLLLMISPAGRFLSSIPGWETLASSFKSMVKGAIRPFALVMLPAVLGFLPLLLLIAATRLKPMRN